MDNLGNYLLDGGKQENHVTLMGRPGAPATSCLFSSSFPASPGQLCPFTSTSTSTAATSSASASTSYSDDHYLTSWGRGLRSIRYPYVLSPSSGAYQHGLPTLRPSVMILRHLISKKSIFRWLSTCIGRSSALCHGSTYKMAKLSTSKAWILDVHIGPIVMIPLYN